MIPGTGEEKGEDLTDLPPVLPAARRSNRPHPYHLPRISVSVPSADIKFITDSLGSHKIHHNGAVSL